MHLSHLLPQALLLLELNSQGQQQVQAHAAHRIMLSLAISKNEWQGGEHGASRMVDVLASQLDALSAVEGMQVTMRADQRVCDLYLSAARAVLLPEQLAKVRS